MNEKTYRLLPLLLAVLIGVSHTAKPISARSSLPSVDAYSWVKVSSPVDSDLVAVDFVSPSDGWAVGSNGKIIHWDGLSWTAISSPTTVELRSVKMLAANDGWAVGEDGVIIRWNGADWQKVSSPTTSRLKSLTFTSAANGWAITDFGGFVRWNGNNWFGDSSVYQIGSLTSIELTSATDGWGVGIGAQRGKIVRWNGSTWSIYSSNEPNWLYDIDMFSGSAGWTVGINGTIARWNGFSWSTTYLANPTWLYTVSMNSTTNGWAAGDRGAIVRWNGSSWTPISSPTTDDLFDIKTISDIDAWAVGRNGTILRYQLPPKRPVIFLPGTGSSANLPCFIGGLKNLNSACFNDDLWGWAGYILSSGYYKLFLSQIANSGYTNPNPDYFSVFHYDWRRELNANVPRLKMWIDKIKKSTKSDKVILVGHSQGGLLARAYVQDSSFQDDVESIITVGVPHLGMPRAYPFWEGGIFYRTGSLEKLFNVICRLCRGDPLELQREMPIFRDLLPIYNYIEDGSDGFRIKNESSLIHRNSKLLSMNSDAAKDLLFRRTKVLTIIGHNVSTPSKMLVIDRTEDEVKQKPYKWQDGVPVGLGSLDLDNKGDETIPAYSAIFENRAELKNVYGVKHASLLNDTEVVKTIFAAIGIPWVNPAIREAELPSSDNSLSILVLDGSAAVTVTNGLGGVVSPYTNTIYGAEYVVSQSKNETWIMLPNYVSMTVQVATTYESLMALSLYRDTTTSSIISDTSTLWDTSMTSLMPNQSLEYVITSTTQHTNTLVASTPVIEAPLRLAAILSGRAIPNSLVSIVDSTNDSVLGTGVTGTDGHFAVSLNRSLRIDDLIYPLANGIKGPIVRPQRATFLPLIMRR